MDTRNLKTFAQQARKLIKEGVRFELQKKGFCSDGIVAFEPQKVSGGTLFDGQIYPEHFYNQWVSLKERIENKGLDYVYEEAAYTWFNRLMALQILSKNNIISVSVLEFADSVRRVPKIVEEARNGRWENIDEESRVRVQNIINDYSKVQEQFAILISAYCRNTPLVSKCFGGIAEYTEILLPSNILSAGNFICMLNESSFITEEDYQKTELLGWLYQFYISEKKDEVFKLDEWSADDVPAGTQIFTPNWIVKYMVENTLGRIYLDHDPYAGFKNDMKYLVEPCEGERPIYEFKELKELRCADFSCGSGHILNEFFDLLLKCYDEEGFSTASAIESIFKYNLVGIDLDTRAKQLSMFSLLLKACQKEKGAFADAHILPNILDMPSIKYDDVMPVVNSLFADYNEQIQKEVSEAFRLMENANELGSIMKFELSDDGRIAIDTIVSYYIDTDNADAEIVKSLNLMLTLTEEYSAICMNPPYMGRKHMDVCLASYTEKKYNNSRTDLFAVFMEVAIDRLQRYGTYGMINMQSWMFLSSFEKLRKTILIEQQIDSLLHLGARTFDELSGEVVQNAAFVISKCSPNKGGIYYRLINYRTCNAKESAFLEKKDLFVGITQDVFAGIPGAPIGYWISNKMLNLLSNREAIGVFYSFREGIHTANNNKFVKLWYECDLSKFITDAFCYDDIDAEGTWIPYNKGGEYRKWYGNNDYVIAFDKNNRDAMASLQGHVRPSQDLYFKEGGTWTAVSMGKFGIRYYPKGFLFDAGGQVAVGANIVSCIGYLNSVLFQYIAKLTMPTMNFKCGVIKNLPDLRCTSDLVNNIVNNCIDFSKQDWDAHETSWDFSENELVRIFKQNNSTLEHTLDTFVDEWTSKFNELHENEEELNRQFIEIYGLQDELTPDVPLDEVTILQQKEIKIENGQLKWNKDVILKQLISYAMGCWMGRYRLDKPGLNIAHPDATDSERANYMYNGEFFDIDDDAIIPLLPRDCPFYDNAIIRFENFVRQVFGEDNFKDNWNYITSTIGNTEDYFIKPTGFWKNHTTMYQKTPIYWLFSSKKGSFKCLVYMHRMNQFTAREVREKYLLKYIEFLRNMIKPLEAEEGTLGRDDKKKLEGYKKALADCEEYDLRLHEVAQKFIIFDLDDGVKVNYAKFGDVLAKI